jgi:hypothetical protein
VGHSFASGYFSVMASQADNSSDCGVTVVKLNARPVEGVVTVLAIITGRQVVFRFASRCDAIVASEAAINNAGVIKHADGP